MCCALNPGRPRVSISIEPRSNDLAASALKALDRSIRQNRSIGLKRRGRTRRRHAGAPQPRRRSSTHHTYIADLLRCHSRAISRSHQPTCDRWLDGTDLLSQSINRSIDGGPITSAGLKRGFGLYWGRPIGFGSATDCLAVREAPAKAGGGFHQNPRPGGQQRKLDRATKHKAKGACFSSHDAGLDSLASEYGPEPTDCLHNSHLHSWMEPRPASWS